MAPRPDRFARLRMPSGPRGRPDYCSCAARGLEGRPAPAEATEAERRRSGAKPGHRMHPENPAAGETTTTCMPFAGGRSGVEVAVLNGVGGNHGLGLDWNRDRTVDFHSLFSSPLRRLLMRLRRPDKARPCDASDVRQATYGRPSPTGKQVRTSQGIPHPQLTRLDGFIIRVRRVTSRGASRTCPKTYPIARTFRVIVVGSLANPHARENHSYLAQASRQVERTQMPVTSIFPSRAARGPRNPTTSPTANHPASRPSRRCSGENDAV
jgi:hypothetical protein